MTTPTARELTKALHGDWHGTYGQVPGPGHSSSDRSVSVRDGDNGEIIVHSFVGENWREIKAIWRELGLLKNGTHKEKTRPRRRPRRPRQTTTRPVEPDEDAKKRAAMAREIWRTSQPAAGSLVEVYLGARGITPPIPPSIRYAPALTHGPTGLQLPAMVAGIQSVASKLVAVHRTYLTLDGAQKAAVSSNRMMLGPCQGGAVRFAKPAEELAVGEGIESCLSVAQACPDMAVWAALSTSGLKAVQLPPEAKSIVILADADTPGEEAARAAAQRFVQEGRKVRIARPPTGCDFNDRLMQSKDVAAPPVEEISHV